MVIIISKTVDLLSNICSFYFNPISVIYSITLRGMGYFTVLKAHVHYHHNGCRKEQDQY